MNAMPDTHATDHFEELFEYPCVRRFSGYGDAVNLHFGVSDNGKSLWLVEVEHDKTFTIHTDGAKAEAEFEKQVEWEREAMAEHDSTMRAQEWDYRHA